MNMLSSSPFTYSSNVVGGINLALRVWKTAIGIAPHSPSFHQFTTEVKFFGWWELQKLEQFLTVFNLEELNLCHL